MPVVLEVTSLSELYAKVVDPDGGEPQAFDEDPA
jgi:hypothetical protein